MRKENLIEEQDNYTPQELFVESECTCCLCGHDLDFQHHIDFLNHKITEKAQCPGCHIRSTGKEHNLH